jgi:predicted RNA-binding Zn-ribbon protein involved in translation (DUF1610 family)
MAKLSIDKESLVAIADALRVHFGEYKNKGTISFVPETPLILKTPNYDDFSESTNNGEWMAAQVVRHTYKINGASKIIIKLAHRESLSEGTFEYNRDYIWVAEGAHSLYRANIGQTFKYKGEYDLRYYCPECGSVISGTGEHYSVGRPVGGSSPVIGGGGNAIFEMVADKELYRCPNCGLEGFCYPYDKEPGGGKAYYDEFMCTDLTLPYVYKFEGTLLGGIRKIDTLGINGDTFTLELFIWERTQETGYYAEVYAFDEDGNQLDCYDLTTDYLPNVYTPDPSPSTSSTMAWAISKLNNYPNGEEVQF